MIYEHRFSINSSPKQLKLTSFPFSRKWNWTLQLVPPCNIFHWTCKRYGVVLSLKRSSPLPFIFSELSQKRGGPIARLVEKDFVHFESTSPSTGSPLLAAPTVWKTHGRRGHVGLPAISLLFRPIVIRLWSRPFYTLPNSHWKNELDLGWTLNVNKFTMKRGREDVDTAFCS